MAIELKPSQALRLMHDVSLGLVREDKAGMAPDFTLRQMSILLTVYLEPPPHTVRVFEPLRHAHEIRLAGVMRREVPGPDETLSHAGEGAVVVLRAHKRVHRQGHQRRRLHRARGIDERARDGDPMGGRSGGIVGAQVFSRKPAHIAVARKLPPGPAFDRALIDVDAFAEQRLRVHARLGRRRAAQRARFGLHAHGDGRGVALRRNASAQAFGGEVGARGRHTPIKPVRRAAAVRGHSSRPFAITRSPSFST